jgi:hypothetical protein
MISVALRFGHGTLKTDMPHYVATLCCRRIELKMWPFQLPPGRARWAKLKAGQKKVA